MEGLIELATEIFLYAFNVGFVFAMGAHIVKTILNAAMGKYLRL